MTTYAEAECATCFAMRPKNEMQQVVIRRVTGESYGHGSASGSSSSNSMSYGGSRPARMQSGQGRSTRRHSNKRVHMATERLWVCEGCKPPKSDWSPAMKQGLLLALGVGGALVYMLVGGFSQSSKTPVVGAQTEPVQAMGASVPSGQDATEVSANPDTLANPVDADFGTAPLLDEGTAAPAPEASSLALRPVEDQMESTSEMIAAASGRAETEAKRVEQAGSRTAEQQRFCESVTAEGRANAAYMASIGC